MNFLTFNFLNSFAKKWKILDTFVIFFAKYLPYVLFFSLILISFYFNFLNILWGALMAGILARGINELIHIFYKIKRPPYFEGANVLIPFKKNFSFPSGHASFFFGIAFYFLFYFWQLGLVIFFLSLIIGFSRVFCGVHWVKDILGGIIVGFISSAMVYYFIILI